jgi:hypothetical protein
MPKRQSIASTKMGLGEPHNFQHKALYTSFNLFHCYHVVNCNLIRENEAVQNSPFCKAARSTGIGGFNPRHRDKDA